MNLEPGTLWRFAQLQSKRPKCDNYSRHQFVTTIFEKPNSRTATSTNTHSLARCFCCSHEKMATTPRFQGGTSFACASNIISNLSSIEAKSKYAQAGNHWTGVPYANYMHGMKIKEKVQASGRGYRYNDTP